MIEPILSLAMSMHSSPGVYAVLLGSGVSRSAGIPTGWEVTLDLIRKLAAMKGEDPGAEPAVWYKERFDAEPDYSSLLNHLGRTADERQQLLRSYFEPTEEEREQGIKCPQAAHRAIARMVRAGHVRVILTTNFDRLIEQALSDEGVTPTVISTADSVRGATPIIHSACTLVKLHGDYLDARIRNTEPELARYEAETEGLLGRVFGEFGLVICGWSAEWDAALRSALERRQSRRYTVYWATPSRLEDHARRLANLQEAVEIRIAGADKFFAELGEKLASLKELDEPHPLTTQAAVATLKRYLPEERHRIRRYDLVVQETNRVAAQLNRDEYPVDSSIFPFDEEAFKGRVMRYEALTRTLRALVATAGQWGRDGDAALLQYPIQRLADTTGVQTGLVPWLKLQIYPSLLVGYAAGINALAAENFDLLKALLDTRIRVGNEESTVALSMNARSLPDRQCWQWLVAEPRPVLTPVSDHLFSVLSALIPYSTAAVMDRESLFDRFEYFLALSCVHESMGENPRSIFGRFIWRHEANPGYDAPAEVHREAEAAGQEWPPIRAGLFGGSCARFEQVEATTMTYVQRARSDNW